MTRFEYEKQKLSEIRKKGLEFLEDCELRKFYENAERGQEIKINRLTLEEASKEI